MRLIEKCLTNHSTGRYASNMNRLFILILLITSINSYACEIPLGEYQLVTESHWGIELNLKESNGFVVTWGAYLAGKPESLKTESYTGTWSCSGNEAAFTYKKIQALSEFKKPRNYPLGIYSNSKAIMFSGKQNRDDLLSGYVFWPKRSSL